MRLRNFKNFPLILTGYNHIAEIVKKRWIVCVMKKIRAGITNEIKVSRIAIGFGYTNISKQKMRVGKMFRGRS